MKKWILIFFSALLISACNKYNLDIESSHRKLLNLYSINDTIYFKNQLGELDTIKIIGIDSIETKRHYLGTVPPMKSINLRIQHLPINNWKENSITGLRNDEIKNQSLITISKVYIQESEFETHAKVRFRDFKGYLNFDKIIDTINSEYTEFKPTEDKVEILYWSNDKGIIGYKKRNGLEYHLKKIK
jgi:hypothetical protein